MTDIDDLIASAPCGCDLIWTGKDDSPRCWACRATDALEQMRRERTREPYELFCWSCGTINVGVSCKRCEAPLNQVAEAKRQLLDEAKRAEAAEQRVAELREALGVLLETSANPGHAFAHEGNVTTSRALHALGCPGCALESARTIARATLRGTQDE